MSVKWVPGLIITSSNLKAKLKSSFTEEAEMNLYKVYKQMCTGEQATYIYGFLDKNTP